MKMKQQVGGHYILMDQQEERGQELEFGSQVLIKRVSFSPTS